MKISFSYQFIMSRGCPYPRQVSSKTYMVLGGGEMSKGALKQGLNHDGAGNPNLGIEEIRSGQEMGALNLGKKLIEDLDKDGSKDSNPQWGM
ncbi:hypothetical protein Dimus_021783 [Dionaea muscipula]